MDYFKEHDIVVQAYSPLVRGGWDNTVVNIGKKVWPALGRTWFVSAHSVTSTTRILRRLSSAGRCNAGG